MDDERITLTEAAELLGFDNVRSARRALDRGGVKAVARRPGRGGESVYLRADVEGLRRPGQGARTDLQD